MHRIHFQSVCLKLLLFVCLLYSSSSSALAEDPLPSWNKSPAKQSIVRFVEKVTNEGSLDFVPVEQRIATFDHDGTLWAEQPFYFQFAFVVSSMQKRAVARSDSDTPGITLTAAWKNMDERKRAGEQGIMELVMSTHAGMTIDAFDQEVSDWIGTARHPTTGRLFSQMCYQPMLELLTYLRANGFKTYIVSAGDVDFMRPWTQRVYGIPPEQVVGSRVKTSYEVRAGKPVIVRLPEIEFINVDNGKPESINRHIGKRPILAFGNSDGDYEMLRWATSGSGPGIGLILHHTDAKREWKYDRDSFIGRLDKALTDAPKWDWVVVDMKQDWKEIFPPLKEAAVPPAP